MRPIQATIHLKALQHNLAIVRSCAPNAKIISVVKANGYGHGLLNAAEGLKATDMFAVLRLDEAVMLREHHFKQPILLLEGVFQASELNRVAELDLSVVVHAEHQMQMLEQVTLAKKITVFAKMNTGMNRLGFKPQDYRAVIQRLEQCTNVKKIVMMTHFATADDARGISTPLEIFVYHTQGLDHEVSLANSATILCHAQAHANWVRPGIMLYGATPVSERSASSFGLKPVMQLTSEIIAVQTLQAGESAGYGYAFTAQNTTRIGIVACGYADGYPRHAGQFNLGGDLGGTPIAVAGKLTRTIGRVSMDMLAVDMTEIPEANIGAKVELWGEQVPVDAVAQSAGTIGYELLCAVAARVPLVLMM